MERPTKIWRSQELYYCFDEFLCQSQVIDFEVVSSLKISTTLRRRLRKAFALSAFSIRSIRRNGPLARNCRKQVRRSSRTTR
jgi:hypothetical protein